MERPVTGDSAAQYRLLGGLGDGFIQTGRLVGLGGWFTCSGRLIAGCVGLVRLRFVSLRFVRRGFISLGFVGVGFARLDWSDGLVELAVSEAAAGLPPFCC